VSGDHGLRFQGRKLVERGDPFKLALRVVSPRYQGGNGWVRARFRNHGSAIAVSDEDARSVLECKHAPRCRHILLKGGLWLLNDADIEAILDENVLDVLPA
jgi:hypothetical protein